MFSPSHYSQNFKLCLPFFFTLDVNPFPQLSCWQWQNHQASSLATSRTALSSSREIIFLFTAAYCNLMDYMRVVQLFFFPQANKFFSWAQGPRNTSWNNFLEIDKPMFVVQKCQITVICIQVYVLLKFAKRTIKLHIIDCRLSTL